jgi:hypothetical protein
MNGSLKASGSWGSGKLSRIASLAAAIGLGVGGVGVVGGCERAEEPAAPTEAPGETTPPAVEQPPAADAPQTDTSQPAAPAPQQPAAGAPAWTVPERWTAVPGERPMRFATFEIPDEAGPLEVAVTQFPGHVGGVLANVNRWRGQMGLPAAAEADLENLVDRFEVPGYTGYIARVEGAESHMLAVGVYEEAEDRTWYVRTTATAEAIDRVEPEVIAFARSIAGPGAEEGG